MGPVLSRALVLIQMSVTKVIPWFICGHIGSLFWIRVPLIGTQKGHLPQIQTGNKPAENSSRSVAAHQAPFSCSRPCYKCDGCRPMEMTRPQRPDNATDTPCGRGGFCCVTSEPPALSLWLAHIKPLVNIC